MICCVVVAAALLLGCQTDAVGAESNQMTYGVGSWLEELGNHRVRVSVARKSDAVWAHIPWRRRDADPAGKAVIVTDQAGKRIPNVVRIDINREFGDIALEPQSGPGTYFVYYMPFTHNDIMWDWKSFYTAPTNTADAGWLSRNNLTADKLAEGTWRSLPNADAVEMQARGEFHRFDPMELIATNDEIARLLASNPQNLLIFAEDRRYPIRMTDDLPYRWIEKGPSIEFAGDACRNEFYTFQVGLYAAGKPVDDVRIVFGGLESDQGKAIPASAFRCFNSGGVDWLGRRFVKTISVPQGKVQPLWVGVQVPKNAQPGAYKGCLTIRPKGAQPITMRLAINVLPQVLEDCGDSDLWRHSRLRWLDSTIGLDDEVIAPYTPLKTKGRTVSCLLRDVRFAETGLPESIKSKGNEILAAPIRMVVEKASGGAIALKAKGPRTTKSAPGVLAMRSTWSGEDLTATCISKMEADGYISFSVTFSAGKPVDVADIRLELPYRREIAKYMTGLGCKGGSRPAEWKSKWDPIHGENAVWIGDVEAGMHVKLRGPDDTWLLTDEHGLVAPDAWKNAGKGGWSISENKNEVLVTAYTGARTVKPGGELMFRFATLITPVKPLNPDHWTQRYFQFYQKVESPQFAIDRGANIINVHQGNEYNPYINYPFLTTQKLSDYVAQAHAKGVKAKVYHTVQMLSNFTTEIWALRSLGDEVFSDNMHEGDPWLKEHLVTGYSRSWHQPYANGETDAAIVTTGLSRWHNYYLEGLSWLMQNVGIDGLYLDGIGYDREIMKRVRKVMDRARPGCLLDLHSGELYRYNDMKSSVVNHYIEHFPYLDSLWLGEMYDYNNESPDYWLVEVSGIPFGLYGEMLQSGTQMPVSPWRGMIYGMSSRHYGGVNPQPMWKFWDSFGIADAKMIGYWDKSCPVKTNNPDVLATAYVKNGETLIALASWAKDPVKVRLSVDWKALGLNAANCTLSAQAIEEFQDAQVFSTDAEIPVEPRRGWLLVLGTR